jgi:hypothetical protein
MTSKMFALFQRPALLGALVGLLLTVGIAVFCPDRELEPGDSRITLGVIGAIFLLPACIATAYLTRLALRNVRKMPRLRVAWLGFALFFTLGVVVESAVEWTAAHRFAREGARTNGLVLGTHREDHNTILVTYTVASVEYRRLARGPRLASSYSPGESIDVYYYASAPGESVFVEPRWQWSGFFACWIVAAGVLPVWLVALGGALVLRTSGANGNGATPSTFQ